MKLSLFVLLLLFIYQAVSQSVINVSYNITNPENKACIYTSTCHMGCPLVSANEKKLHYNTNSPSSSCTSRDASISDVAVTLKPGSDYIIDYVYLKTGARYECDQIKMSKSFHSFTCHLLHTNTTSSLVDNKDTSSTAENIEETIFTATPACSNNSTVFDKKNRNGYRGDCCKTQLDCIDSCIDGECNGSFKEAISSPSNDVSLVPAIASCSLKRAVFGKRRGNGSNGDCCKTQHDCKEVCIEKKCNSHN